MEKESLVSKLTGQSELQIRELKMMEDQIGELKSTAKKSASAITDLENQLSLQRTTYEQEISRLTIDCKHLTNRVNSIENDKIKLVSINDNLEGNIA